jgi:cell division protease FtsH
MKPTWRNALLWALPVVLVGIFLWQSTLTPMANNGAAARNAASTRMTYGRFLEYLDANRVKSVDVYDNGRTAIVEATDPELEGRVQRLRVDLPGVAPELMTRLRSANIALDAHPSQNNSAIWGLLGNLLFPVLLLAGLFLLFRRSNNMPGGPGQAMSFGKSKARFQMDAKTGVMFDDVAMVVM